ncbi:hypothetical protein BD408DRAFT_414264 [Parasitella parasitica]|nr:hypothetical protein BD408DRAFT_414264 [Parasitella parasitica]
MDQQENTQQVAIDEDVLSDTASVASSSSEATATSTYDADEKLGKFVSRVTSFPIVQDGVSTVHAIANKTSLGRFALSTANSTLSTVSRYTHSQPAYVQSYYESYIQPHVEKADTFGCRSLDLLQDKFPVVNQSTTEIVRAVTAPSCQIVDGVRVRIDASIKQPANQVAKEANKRIGSVVDNVEAVLDRYLPASEKKGSDEAHEINQAVRAYYLMNDATARLSHRVTEQVKNSASQFPRSRDDLARITETSALVQKTTANIQALQETIAQSVSVYAQAAQKRLPPAVTEHLQTVHAKTNEKLATLTQQVSVQLSQLVDCVKFQSNETPEWLKNRVASLVEIANKQIELVRAQFTRNDISSLDKAKNVAQALQKQVLPILQNAQAQLNYYSEVARQKASTDLKLPLEYLGLAHAPKLAST